MPARSGFVSRLGRNKLGGSRLLPEAGRIPQLCNAQKNTVQLEASMRWPLGSPQEVRWKNRLS